MATMVDGVKNDDIRIPRLVIQKNLMTFKELIVPDSIEFKSLSFQHRIWTK